MPRIKVKNIPDATYKRICTNCIKCSRAYCFQFDTVRIPGGYIPSYTHKDVIELSEKEFPTNREWMESLSSTDLAALMTTGYVVETGKYKGHIVTTCIKTSLDEALDWLSKPCQYLMEEDENDPNDIG